MGKRLQGFGEVRIVDETNGFGLDFVKKDIGVPLQTWEQYSKEGRFGTCKQLEGEKMRKTHGLWRGNRAFEMHV